MFSAHLSFPPSRIFILREENLGRHYFRFDCNKQTMVEAEGFANKEISDQ
jgi:hypothetical protein